MFNKKRALTAAVLLSCSFFMAPYYAHAAEEEEPNCEHPSSTVSVKSLLTPVKKIHENITNTRKNSPYNCHNLKSLTKTLDQLHFLP